MSLFFSHHNIFNEFITAYVFSNEPLYSDVIALERPDVFYTFFSDTISLDAEPFVEIADTNSKYLATLYSVEMQINSDLDGAEFKVCNLQDLAGNGTDDIISFLSLSKTGASSTLLKSHDSKMTMKLNETSSLNSDYVSLIEQNPKAVLTHYKLRNINVEDVLKTYSVGPLDAKFDKNAVLTYHLDDFVDADGPGVYRLDAEGYHKLSSVFNVDSRTLKFESDRAGTFIISKNSHNDSRIETLPVDYALAQNFPNPFNPLTEINFSLKEAGYVSLNVYDVLGRKVTELVAGKKNAGSYSIMWQGRDALGKTVSSGIYFYKIKVNNYEKIRKMSFVK